MRESGCRKTRNAPVQRAQEHEGVYSSGASCASYVRQPTKPPYYVHKNPARHRTEVLHNLVSQAPLVEPDLPPRLHHGCLSSRVRYLQAQAQGLVLRSGEPLGGFRLQGRKLPHYPGQVA